MTHNPPSHQTITPAMLIERAREGDLTGVNELLSAGVDPRANHSQALRDAARLGHVAVVRALIPKSDPSALNSAAYHDALFENHDEIAAMLLSHSELPPMRGSFID